MSEFSLQSYEEALSALFVRFPSVQTAGFASDSYKPGLDNMRRFDAALGSPSASLNCIHVAGTNGKGSVCHMLAAALAATGLRVGLYTSPHLLDFRERMRIVGPDGLEFISREEVWDFLQERSQLFAEFSLSFFEITTGMAFDWFVRRSVDVAVIETGLGGRLDSTNIISGGDLSIVTSIGLDHCSLLGYTREAVAGEKAGIFKPGTPALVWGSDPQTDPSFEKAACECAAPLFFADDFEFPDEEEALLASLDLGGDCQRENLHTVLAALTLLDVEPFDVEVSAAIASAAARTAFLGRWQQMPGTAFKAWDTVRPEQDAPRVILDIGHNPPALAVNFRQLEGMLESGEISALTIVYGIMADKALDDIIPLMPRDATFIFAAPDSPRSLPAADLLARFKASRPTGCARLSNSVSEALSEALRVTPAGGVVYVGGSTFVVAEALAEAKVDFLC